MRSRARIAWVVAGLLCYFAGWWAVTYNQLVAARFAVDAQWAQVETQYQRRVDLVPNLATAGQGILAQERAVFRDLTLARTAYLSAPSGSPDRVRAANGLERALGRLVALVEAYPQLRSADVVARLMDELAGTENRIAVERRRYNERVQAYNTLVQKVPGSLVASAGHFRPRPYFTAASAAGAPAPVTLPGR